MTAVQQLNVPSQYVEVGGEGERFVWPHVAIMMWRLLWFFAVQPEHGRRSQPPPPPL